MLSTGRIQSILTRPWNGCGFGNAGGVNGGDERDEESDGSGMTADSDSDTGDATALKEGDMARMTASCSWTVVVLGLVLL